jgi:hypothetical protein
MATSCGVSGESKAKGAGSAGAFAGSRDVGPRCGALSILGFVVLEYGVRVWEPSRSSSATRRAVRVRRATKNGTIMAQGFAQAL